MKKLLLFVVIAALLLSGCGINSEQAAEEIDKTEGQTSETNTTPSGAVMPIYFKVKANYKMLYWGKQH